MKKILVSSVAIMVVLAFQAFGQEPAATHGPKIVCHVPVFQFGEKDNAGAVEHGFEIVNEGDMTLEIKNVRPACGCTVANISEKMIPPGQTAIITTKLSLSGRQGPQHKTITVESNDPNQPNFMLALEGTAVTEMLINPMQVFFGRIKSSQVTTNYVEVVYSGTQPLEIVSAACDQPAFTASFQTVEAGKKFRVEVVTQPPFQQGQLSGMVILTSTNNAKYPLIQIPLNAFVYEDPPSATP